MKPRMKFQRRYKECKGWWVCSGYHKVRGVEVKVYFRARSLAAAYNGYMRRLAWEQRGRPGAYPTRHNTALAQVVPQLIGRL